MTSATAPAAEVINLMDDKRLIYGIQLEHQITFRALLFVLAYYGYGNCRVLGGKRSLIAQQILYGKGRSKEECLQADVPTKYSWLGAVPVTWCLPKDSKHVRGLAIDISFHEYKNPAWDEIGTLAGICGITWGGNWSVRDYGHFEI